MHVREFCKVTNVEPMCNNPEGKGSLKLNLPIILSKKVSREPHAASVPRAKNSHQQSNFVHTNGVTSVKEAYPTAVEELRNFGERYIRKVHERIYVVTSDRTGNCFDIVRDCVVFVQCSKITVDNDGLLSLSCCIISSTSEPSFFF